MGQTNKPLPRKHGHSYLDTDDIALTNKLHEAGLHHDRSQLAALLDVVNNPSDQFQFLTAVHSLARIGDQQALPVLEAAIHRLRSDREYRDYAEVARARLLAEAEAHKHTAYREKAQVRLHTFLSTLQLTAHTLNTTVVEDWKSSQDDEREKSTRAQYAIRELADMIYHTRDLPLAEAAKSEGIDFNTDVCAKHKIHLALLTSQQRVDWIIEELSNHRIAEKEGDLNLLQLAADEGPLASNAAAIRVLQMDKHRERYTYPSGYFSHSGFTDMFRIISGVGDSKQIHVIEHFMHDKNKWIAYYANQAYPSVQKGIPWKWRVGY